MADMEAEDSASQARGGDGRFLSAHNQSRRAGQPEAAQSNPKGEATSTKPAAETAPKPAGSDGKTSTDQTESGERRAESEKKTESEKAAKREGEQENANGNGSKFAKNQQRIAKTWQQINEEKLAVEAEKAKLAGERAEWEAQRAAATRTTRNPEPGTRNGSAGAGGFTAEQYARAAEQFEAQGKFDLADAAREQAEKLRTAAPLTPALSPRRGEGGEFAARQKESWEKAKTEFPEILDTRSPVNKGLMEFIKAHPQVLQYDQGPYIAADYVRAKMAAARVEGLSKEAAQVPELKKQVESLTAKINELEKLTSLPDGGGPTSRSGESAKGFAEKTSAQMEAELERELAGQF